MFKTDLTLSVSVEYEYFKGFKGSQYEPPEPETVDITGVFLVSPDNENEVVEITDYLKEEDFDDLIDQILVERQTTEQEWLTEQALLDRESKDDILY